MTEVSLFRLYLLRATYLLIVVGLGLTIWPSVLSHPVEMSLMRGVVHSVLGAVSLLALIGLRYPLQMLPLLLFELVWKTIWVVSYGIPLWATNRLDAAPAETMQACLMGLVIFPLVLPWPYVWARYVRQAGDPWKRSARP